PHRSRVVRRWDLDRQKSKLDSVGGARAVSRSQQPSQTQEDDVPSVFDRARAATGDRSRSAMKDWCARASFFFFEEVPSQFVRRLWSESGASRQVGLRASLNAGGPDE